MDLYDPLLLFLYVNAVFKSNVSYQLFFSCGKPWLLFLLRHADFDPIVFRVIIISPDRTNHLPFIFYRPPFTETIILRANRMPDRQN